MGPLEKRWRRYWIWTEKGPCFEQRPFCWKDYPGNSKLNVNSIHELTFPNTQAHPHSEHILYIEQANINTVNYLAICCQTKRSYLK